MKNVEINCSMSTKMLIDKNILMYLGGLDSRFQWDLRTIEAHKKISDDEKKEYERRMKNSLEFIETEEGMSKVESFVNECFKVYKSMLFNKEYIKEYLEGKKIIFIMGYMRTGGTYLTSKLFETFGLDIKDFNLNMVHDNTPTYECLYNWQNPNIMQKLLFELAQFLVWAKREFKNSDVIIKKRTGLLHCLPILYEIFGNNAEYILTIRHPVPAAFSFAKMIGKEPEGFDSYDFWQGIVQNRKNISSNQWEKFNFVERSILYWQINYEDVAKWKNIHQNLTVVPYGEKTYNTFFENIAKKYNKKKVDLNSFKIANKNYDSVWSEYLLDKSMKEVESLWVMNNIKFPEMDIK